MTRGSVRYIAQLPAGKTSLWCFLIWYVVTGIRHFDPAPAIWLNALGISAIIGVALYLSVREPGRAPPDRCARHSSPSSSVVRRMTFEGRA